tara:strand:+ start:544 stop:1458 length:915 start_codon:yes stop_codon:yes gene_type:complete
MYAFGEIDKSSTIIQNNLVNYKQNFTSASNDVEIIKIISGSTNTDYWKSLNVLFYTSGSNQYLNEHKFAKPSNNLSLNPTHGTQYLKKYHNYPSSSLITIPSQYYGEKIKEGSFLFTDLNNTDNDGYNPTIKDDGLGNLYSTNANSNFGTLTASHGSVNNSISSSENYVGNIFYDKGIAIITETGSWSGSVKYSDFGTNYNLKFGSYNTITNHEYNVVLKPNEFNHSTNYSLRAPLSGSNPIYRTLSTEYLATNFTSSNFQPYITTINLYQKNMYDAPIIQAKLPKPIRKSDKINLIFKIKLDI